MKKLSINTKSLAISFVGNKVDKIASIFNEKSEFRIGLAPEGTRAKVEKLRTGFYHIAKKANAPIIMVTLDYTNKIIDRGKKNSSFLAKKLVFTLQTDLSKTPI